MGYISIEKGTFREIRVVYQICKNSRWVTLVSCCVNFLRIYIFIFIRLWRCSLILSCLKSPDHPNRFFFPALSKMASHRALLRFCDKLSARHLQKTRRDFQKLFHNFTSFRGQSAYILIKNTRFLMRLNTIINTKCYQY